MIRLVALTALVCACQSYSDLKQKYFAPDAPWTHVQPPLGPVTDRLGGPCWIPTYSDDYYGFSVGQPPGWKIDYSTGTLMVVKDDRQLEGVMIYPVRLRKPAPPEELASQFARGIGDLVRYGGGTFELVDKTTDGRVASGLMLATIAGVRVRGPLQVIVTPGFVTLKAYWAPETELDKEEPTLKQVVSCFQRKMMVISKSPVAPPGGPKTSVNMARAPRVPAGADPQVAPLQPYHGRFMALSMPAGWKVADESQYGIDIVAGDGLAGFGFGWFQNPFKRADVYVVESLRQYFPDTHIVSSGFPPAPPDWQIAVAEFEGTQKGFPIHGVARMAIGQGVALSSGWQASPKVWDKLRPTLEAIAGSVQIQAAAVAQVNADIRRQLASYPPVRSSVPSGGSTTPDRRYLNDWAEQDRQSQRRSDAMLDQERATSPTTGETYVVPTNAWNPSGPAGPGYYRPTPGGGAERLEQQDP